MVVERKDLFSHYGPSRISLFRNALENGRPSLGSSRYLKRVKEGNPAPGVQASCSASLTIGYHGYGIGAVTVQSALKRIDAAPPGASSKSGSSEWIFSLVRVQMINRKIDVIMHLVT